MAVAAGSDADVASLRAALAAALEANECWERTAAELREALAGRDAEIARQSAELERVSAALASSLGLDPHHCRLRPGARQRHEGVPVVGRIRLGGRQVLEQAAGRPGEVHFGHALGSACHHACRIERHAQVPGRGLQEPAGELAQSGRPGLGRV